MKLRYFLLSYFIFISISVSSQKCDTLKIYFDINKYELTGEHKELIDKTLKIKNINNIKILGFTDFLGTTGYNMQLSEKRSNNAKEYLIKSKISEEIITICNGKGVHENSSEENRPDISDRGIKDHRIVEIIYYTYDKPNNIVENPQETYQDQQMSDPDEKPVVIPIFENLSDDQLVVGNKIVLENILFFGGSPKFRQESANSLNQLIMTMRNNPTLIIEIQGHVCCVKDGKDSYDYENKDYNLSLNRAKAVFDYLVDNGIDENRMSYAGYGSEFKRFPLERTEQEANMNRRVEILILDK